MTDAPTLVPQPAPALSRLPRHAPVHLSDPRTGQIAGLGSFVLLGLGPLGFDLELGRVLLNIGVAIVAEFLIAALHRRPTWDARSALISGLGLCLLFRTDELWVAVACPALSIASKSFRIRGKHVFNPTNGAICGLMLLTPHAWSSPGQWGHYSVIAIFVVGLGALVSSRSNRVDIALAFLGTWVAIQFGRALYLGDPLTIPLHRLNDGALMLFSFFMITDPKTSPDRRIPRVVFGMLVALGAGVCTYVLFRPLGFLWAYFVLTPLVPLFDWLEPGTRFDWNRPTNGESSHVPASPASSTRLAG